MVVYDYVLTIENLTEKTYPERQPIPRIQDILNGLGGNKGLTVLDQGKAYHQGFVAEKADLLPHSSPLGGYINGTGSHLVY